ncbi:MAG: peptidoglycan-binding domain-containing protein [Pseudomonadota bacterium]
MIEVAESEPDSLVRQVQLGLSEAGYFDGAIDGVLGDETAAAIRAFEAERELPVTGEPNLGLLAAVSDAMPAPEPALAPAALEEVIVAAVAEPTATEQAVAGPAAVSTVAEIQAALNTAGYGPLEVDGVMGPRTRGALDQFALSRGLEGQGMTPAVLRALGEAAR